ncbi:dehydrogenase/reductase SDR family member 7 [Senna tora]|uniref:Dehydrogenase/reductase SDR family member 7 n=1 Tax=Senna tora TaxID=362788 RepID=A0A835CL74_9FABA|nr:dehydrogenase/reductase SDR family member 7 [Senna tora]
MIWGLLNMLEKRGSVQCSTIAAKPLANLGAKLIIYVSMHLNEVKILPMDLTTIEESLKKSVEEAESLLRNSSVDYMIHNAAFKRPVLGFIYLILITCISGIVLSFGSIDCLDLFELFM